ncbi:hypothetical protein DUY81_01145 [Acidipropionibacterium acidipropionici]|jgi:hypothetical protein|uniref:TadE-like domain-containing protein n=1 Tax=Acidipropionibacterium acidipropionici TaxID=1748 RepID=A0AAC8YFT9_9ACTN|nr:TadE/TadG family type IV pilus assembly protein [Acidipropionibacterium acidipropionici]AMS05823.1 hypothetical protein AXH35_10605 [Acidipropionibacterium acidipropionici]AZP36604.1 hypothetical protein DUY81_01145 [Acidipropionibacterium acidipropionici]MDN6557540.1 hypothetical protein [Acidipropionibacterium acidipropionici]QCV96392.1 hypothetical protein FEZ30_15035 [Acidipropionibacterium acidipropionici]
MRRLIALIAGPQVIGSSGAGRRPEPPRGAGGGSRAGRGPGRGPYTDRGAAALEAVVILPAILLLAALTAASWRLWQTRGDVHSAAEAAARAASVSSGPAQGVTAGRQVALADLAGTRCSAPTVSVDPAGLSAPVGFPGRVGVRVACTVSMTDLLLPGLPGSFHVSASAEAPVDSHRERQP